MLHVRSIINGSVFQLRENQPEMFEARRPGQQVHYSNVACYASTCNHLRDQAQRVYNRTHLAHLNYPVPRYSKYSDI